MAQGIVPDPLANQAVLDDGSTENIGEFSLHSGDTIDHSGNIRTLDHMLANCTWFIERGIEHFSDGPDTQTYRLCLMQLEPSVTNVTNLSVDSNLTRSPEQSILPGSMTGLTETDAFANTQVTSGGSWIKAFSTRDDLLRISIQSTVLIAIFLASVLANSFVFVVFCRKPTLLSNSYRFVLNLAVCNCLMTLLVMPFVLISTFTQEWILGRGSCEAIGMLAISLFVASILTLLLIALDRYHAIMKPLHYHLAVINKRSSLCIAGVWVLSLLIAVPPIIGWNHYTYQPGKAMCTVNWRSTSLPDRLYSFFFVLFCFAIPYFVMLWVYVCAFRTAQRTTARARRNSVTPEHAISTSDLQGITQRMLQSRERRRSSVTSMFFNSTRRRSSSSMTRAIPTLHKDDWKAAKTSLVVMSAFTVCWLPFFILITMEAIIGPSLVDFNSQKDPAAPRGIVIPHWLESTALCLALAGCALNPLVYVFRSERIKFEIKKLFCPRRSRRNEQDKEASFASMQNGGKGCSIQTSKRGSPSLNGLNEKCMTASVCTGTSSVKMSPCSSSASIANSTIVQAARIAGAAASMVVTFNEDSEYSKDGVCL